MRLTQKNLGLAVVAAAAIGMSATAAARDTIQVDGLINRSAICQHRR